MSSDRRHLDGQEIQSAPSDDAHLWAQAPDAGIPWRPAGGGPPLEEDAFPVEWQLSPEEDEDPSATQMSRDEEAKMFQNRLLRLYRVYYPPPERS